MLRTPPRVLSSTAATCGPPFGTKRPQVQILSPGPVHDEAASAEDTDWPQILALYGLLEQMTSNPMVTLNRAVAAAMVDGSVAGLRLLESPDEPLAGHRRLDAVRPHLLEMAGDHEAAIAHYQTAATTSVAAT